MNGPVRWLAGAGALAGAAALAAPAAPGWEQEVRPLLQRRCFKCHGESVRMGGLDLRSPAAMARGGARGTALVLRAPERSPLYRRTKEGSMPPGSEPKLTREEVELLRAWILAGAPGDATPSAGSAAGHWAFRPPKPQALPRVRQRARVRSPVDAFILARLEAAGIPPPPEADRQTLLRRATLDVTGLPPAPEEREAFLRDTAPGAYERLVDRLLASPRYGERWARHWLDVARYAESNGYERDGAKPHAWRYRDYVIDSLNRDKPYDRFLTEQLAGDELEGANAETCIAATFLRLGTWDDEPAEPKLDRYEQLDDVLGTTATAFLGVTLRCARCHDHKFEPYSQKEYYRLLAVFEPLKRPQNDREDLDRLVGTEAELAAYEAAREQVEQLTAPHEDRVDRLRWAVLQRLLPAGTITLPEPAVAAFRAERRRRTKEERELVARHGANVEKAVRAAESAAERREREELEGRIAAERRALLPEPPRAYVWYEDTAQAPETRVLHRGDPAQPRDTVTVGVPAVLGIRLPEPPRPRARSTGRRLWLARWMTRGDHPLTARVMVNRVWQGHFGEGLVPTENDFGLMGRRPSHPELLDWLAIEFVRSGWSLKRLHRLILTSSTYRASAAWSAASARRDPEDRLLWRWRPRRLEAETVRDSILAVSGDLNPEMGGPSVYPPIPREVLEGQSRPGDGWGQSDPPQAARRSIYIFSKRSLAVPELEVLDAPDTTSSCEQRPVSTIAPQALTFLNGGFINAQARLFAERLRGEAGEDVSRQVRGAFLLALGREPTPAEVRESYRFLREEEGSAGMQSFCQALLNSNEFVYLH